MHGKFMSQKTQGQGRFQPSECRCRQPSPEGWDFRWSKETLAALSHHTMKKHFPQRLTKGFSCCGNERMSWSYQTSVLFVQEVLPVSTSLFKNTISTFTTVCSAPRWGNLGINPLLHYPAFLHGYSAHSNSLSLMPTCNACLFLLYDPSPICCTYHILQSHHTPKPYPRY